MFPFFSVWCIATVTLDLDLDHDFNALSKINAQKKSYSKCTQCTIN